MRRCFWSWSRADGLALCCSKDGEGSTGQKSSFKLQQFKSLTPAKKSSIHRGVRHLWWSILCFQQLCLTALVQQHSISAWCTEPVVIIVQFEFVVPFQDFLTGHPWTALLEKMEGGLIEPTVQSTWSSFLHVLANWSTCSPSQATRTDKPLIIPGQTSMTSTVGTFGSSMHHWDQGPRSQPAPCCHKCSLRRPWLGRDMGLILVSWIEMIDLVLDDGLAHLLKVMKET